MNMYDKNNNSHLGKMNRDSVIFDQIKYGMRLIILTKETHEQRETLLQKQLHLLLPPNNTAQWEKGAINWGKSDHFVYK